MSLIHRSDFSLGPPPSRWADSVLQIVQVDIAPDIAQKLAWLAERWSVSCHGLVADILTAELCGRYLMTQVAAHCVDPAHGVWASNDSIQTVRLREPVVEALNQRAYEGRVPAGEMARRLIRSHLLGRFNPQMTSTGTMDMEGNELRENKADIKVRLPESLAKKVQALADLHDLSKSDVMRNCLMLEAYGRIRYEQWTLEGHWRPKQKAAKPVAQAFQSGEATFSVSRDVGQLSLDITRSAPRTQYIQTHGKSTNDSRVFLPTLLKERLEHLAKTEGQSLSEFCRSLLVRAI